MKSRIAASDKGVPRAFDGTGLLSRAETPQASQDADLPLLPAVTRHGITWTFEKPVPVGRFVNGDSHAVGPVPVSAIDPPPRDGRNGSVVNLPAEANRGGFDDRTRQGRCDSTLRVAPPLRLVSGDALVSTMSFDEVGMTGRALRPRDRTISLVRSAAVLTCLAAPVRPDAFRPSYCGGEKNPAIHFARNLRRDLLPSLPRGPDAPDLQRFAGHFARPWIDTLNFGFDAPAEYMPDYGREVARATAIAALLLALDFPPAEKEPLLIGFAQYGLELAGIALAGHPGRPAHGGHGSGRTLPLVLAARLLQEPRLPPVKARFSEDMQTLYGKGWTGAQALYAGHVGKEGGVPTRSDGALTSTCSRKSGLPRSGRTIAAAAQASRGWERRLPRGRWGSRPSGHPPFFDHVERWMTEDDEPFIEIIEKQIGKSYRAPWARRRQAWDRFVETMWHACAHKR